MANSAARTPSWFLTAPHVATERRGRLLMLRRQRRVGGAQLEPTGDGSILEWLVATYGRFYFQCSVELHPSDRRPGVWEEVRPRLYRVEAPPGKRPMEALWTNVELPAGDWAIVGDGSTPAGELLGAAAVAADAERRGTWGVWASADCDDFSFAFCDDDERMPRQ